MPGAPFLPQSQPPTQGQTTPGATAPIVSGAISQGSTPELVTLDLEAGNVVIPQVLSKVGVPPNMSAAALAILKKNTSPEVQAVIEDPEVGIQVVATAELEKHLFGSRR
jgi:hypothetical protein